MPQLVRNLPLWKGNWQYATAEQLLTLKSDGEGITFRLTLMQRALDQV